MSGLKIGIVGVTGLVGEELIKIINKSSIEFENFKLFASERSCGTEIVVQGKKYIVEPLTKDSGNGLDYAFFCADVGTSKAFIPAFCGSGVVCIDNSSAYRMDPRVPLIIPEINPRELKKDALIIANPNCSTIIALMALQPLHELFFLRGFCVSTYQAVSGAGKSGIGALESDESGDHELSHEVFGEQIARNLVPKIGDIDEFGYSVEENKMCYESRKILKKESLKISAMCVRVPVIRAHSMAIFASFEKNFDKNSAIIALKNDRYLDFYENDDFPCPLRYSDCDKCGVGRLRSDSFLENGASFWVCGDQIRRGAATNAFKIMLLRENLLS